MVKIFNWEEVGFRPKSRDPYFHNDTYQPDPFLTPNLDMQELAKDYLGVKLNRSRYQKSVSKGDLKLEKPSKMNPLWVKALKYTRRHFAPLFTGCKLMGKSTVNMSANPGPTLSETGFKSKEEVFLSEEGREVLLTQEPETYTTSCKGKNEVLSSHDVLVREKLRTYFPDDMARQMWSKFYFADQSERLKASKSWARYGFVKQYGGFNKLFKELEEKTYVRFCGDVSGWDRAFPLLEEVYNLRVSFLPNHSRNRVSAFVNSMVNHKVILKDGYQYSKGVGNISGGDLTTDDNCIGHAMIQFYLALKMLKYLGLYEEPSRYETIMKNFKVNVYGDDFCNGVKFDISNEALTQIYTETYQEFGLTLKFLTISRGDESLDELEFLGGHPRLVGGKYFPLIRVGKIVFSLLHGSKDPTVTLSKMSAVFDNLFLDPREEAQSAVSFVVSEARRLLLEEAFVGSLNPKELKILTQIASGRTTSNAIRLRNFIFGEE